MNGEYPSLLWFCFGSFVNHSRRYHGKCLKIARGKVKEYDSYTCPICDWRVKIPRDAARPKLEDLLDWQAEIPDLPFQPEEEHILDSIVEQASAFRDFLRPFTNPSCMTAEEVPTQIFYLRKIEGAEVLLTYETNYFRQEIHKWAPVAPEPPPILEQSLSTRKPRPTKQQKIMAQLGIEKPEDLPLHLRTKQHTFGSGKRKSSEGQAHRPPPLQPAPPNHVRTPSVDARPPTGGAPMPQTLPPIATSQHPNSFTFSQPFPLSNETSPTYPPTSSAFLPQATSTNSPPFGPTSPRTHQSSLDPSLFSPPSFHRADQLRAQGLPPKDEVGVDMDGDGQNPFASSPRANMDEIFADLTNQDAEPETMEMSHANEALEALRSASNSGNRERSMSGSGDALEAPARENELTGSPNQTGGRTSEHANDLEAPNGATSLPEVSKRGQESSDTNALADEFLT